MKYKKEDITANYHTHTYRCFHAEGKDEEYVIKAIEYGFKTLGFSDHEEITQDNFYPNNNGEEVTANYLNSILSLKEKYKDKIDIKVGVEALYLPSKEEHFKHLKEKGIEYFILGQHEVPDENGNMYYIFDRPMCNETIERYVHYLCLGIESGFFSYVAHPDLFIRGVDKVDEYVLNSFRIICECAKKHDIPLEINLAGARNGSKYNFQVNYSNKYSYPSEEFFKIAGKVGNKVIIGFDAHSPCAFKEMNLEYGLHLVKKYKLNLITKLDIK